MTDRRRNLERPIPEDPEFRETFIQRDVAHRFVVDSRRIATCAS